MLNPFKGKHGPLLIAEIGGNHEGDFDYAKRLTTLVLQSGADYVKFQLYTGDTLVSSVESPDRNRHFKRFELSKEQHQYLAQMVLDAGVGYTSSVWDVDAMQWLDPYISIYKIGSGDLTAYPVLRKTASLGKPMILSTGLSTLQEVLDSVAIIQSANDAYRNPSYLALLQCTSMYPIPASAAHLRVMHTLRQATGLTVGYSDHTEGSDALRLAAAMGASILEFHFTDTREGKAFRDHKLSLTRDEVKALIDDLHAQETLQGDTEKRPVPEEVREGHVVSFRRAVYPSRDIAQGEVLDETNLTVLRPNHGIDARHYDVLLGSTAKVPLKKHQKLSFDLVTLQPT